MIGTQIGKWLITEEIGDGGHAFVFKGTCGDEVAAIKMLKPSVATEPDLEKRFQLEVAALGLLQHPGIVGFKEYLHLNGYHYLILEYMDAGAGDQLLRNTGPLEVRYALPIFSQVVGGIAYAHSKGYIHRDIKPNNILLNRMGQAKITDFGIAKLVGGENMTRPGFVLGTTQYMAPEYLSQGQVSAQTDIYALGVLLYEMVTGRKPFEFKSADEPLVAFAKRVCLGTPTPPSAYRPIPDALEKIILKAIAREPRKRHKDVDRFAAELRKAFPDLVDRPIVIPEGKPMTKQIAIQRVEAPTAAQRPAISLEMAMVGGLAVVMGIVAAIAPLGGLSRAVLGALSLAGLATAAWWWTRRAAAGSAASPAAALEAPAPRKEEEEAPAGPMPFHGGAEDRSYAESVESELQAFLVETAGPAAGKRYGLRPVSRIGRDVRFDIRPNDPEISRHHAALTFNGQTFLVRDLGSMNGTFVNEVRLAPEQDHPLQAGDIVRVGRTSMRFVRG